MVDSEPPPLTVSPGAHRAKFLPIVGTFLIGAVLIGSAIYAWLHLSTTCQDVVLHSPVNISAAWTSASLTRIEWAPSITTTGNRVAYAVSVCDGYGPCFANRRLMGCTHIETSHTWLEFGSNVDTPYCIVVKATSLCGSDVLVSDPSVMELRTPSFAPGNFQVSAKASSPTSAQVVAFLPQVKNGALERCYITLHGSEPERTFSCAAMDNMTSVTEVTGLEHNTQYNLSVTFANVHNGWEMGTRKTITFMTLDVPADADNHQEGDGNSKECPYRDIILLVAVIWVIPQIIAGNKDEHRRRRRRRRRKY